MTEEVTNQVEEQVAAPAPAAAPAPDLAIGDLVALKSIIEVATQRGAFKAAELEAVGKVFNKLSTFLDSVATKKE